jgi:putative lipoprotein
MTTVRGKIALPDDVPAEAGEILVVVEDVSRADAPSAIVGETRLGRTPLAPGATIPFSAEVPENAIDPRAAYSLRVHVDVSGSGEIEKGDLVSTQSYPVLTRGAGGETVVRVRRV